MKRSKWGKEKYKPHSLRRKRTPGNVMLEPSPVLKQVKVRADVIGPFPPESQFSNNDSEAVIY